MRLSRDGFAVDAALAKGRELPEWFTNAPEIPEGAEIFFQHFYDLTTCRQYGDQPGPIPWLATAQYADHHGYVGSAKEIVIQVIREMDNTYLEWSAKEINRRQRAAKAT